MAPSSTSARFSANGNETLIKHEVVQNNLNKKLRKDKKVAVDTNEYNSPAVAVVLEQTFFTITFLLLLFNQ